MDYSAVQGDPDKEQFHVRDERFGFIDKRLVSLYSEQAEPIYDGSGNIVGVVGAHFNKGMYNSQKCELQFKLS